MAKDMLQVEAENTHLGLPIADTPPAVLTPFFEPTTLALIYKKGNLGFYVCHVSWFSLKKYKYVWNIALKEFYIQTVLLFYLFPPF